MRKGEKVKMERIRECNLEKRMRRELDWKREQTVEDEHEGSRSQCERKRIPREKFWESWRGEERKLKSERTIERERMGDFGRDRGRCEPKLEEGRTKILMKKRERDERKREIDEASVTENTKKKKFKERKRNQMRGRSRVGKGERDKKRLRRKTKG